MLNNEIVNEFMELYLEPMTPPIKKRGHYQKFKCKVDRIAFHQKKFKDMKYSSTYYNINKKKLLCPYCNKIIIGLTLAKHQRKNRKCVIFQDYIDILKNI